MFLESYLLWGDEYLILLWWKTHQNRLLFRGRIHRISVILINKNNAPFRILIEIGFQQLKRLLDSVSLPFQFAHQLGHNLSVGLASKLHIRQVFSFDFRMVINNSIVNEEDFLILVIVGVGISLVHLSACGPSGMGYADGWVYCLGCELLN